MTDRKCNYCGSSEFVSIPLMKIEAPGIFPEQVVDAFACVKCGHVEIFAKSEIILGELIKIDAQKIRDAKIAECKKQIETITNEIAELEAIVTDENQTVKRVNEAKERIKQLKNDLIRIRG